MADTYAIMLYKSRFIVAMKATADPNVDANWSQVDYTTNNGRDTVSLWCFETTGGDIRIASVDADGKIYNHIFDVGVGRFFFAPDFVVTNKPNLAEGVGVSISERSDGDRIILYTGDDANDDAVFYARREVTTWTTNIRVDGGSAEHFTGAVVILGVSDRMHFFYNEDSGSAATAYHRSLSSSNSLDTVDQAIDTTIVVNTNHPFGQAVSYVSGATKVRIPYVDADGSISIAKLDSGADPTLTTDTVVSALDVKVNNGTPVMCLAVDGTTIHLLFSDITDTDVFHDENADDAGWGTDEEIIDAATINRISCNVYTRGAKVLAFLFLDGTTAKYCEYPLAGGSIGKLSLVEFPDQNYYVGPFEI